MLLIKLSATVTVYRGLCRTLFSARDYLPVYHGVGIIGNNSLVGGYAWAEV